MFRRAEIIKKETSIPGQIYPLMVRLTFLLGCHRGWLIMPGYVSSNEGNTSLGRVRSSNEGVISCVVKQELYYKGVRSENLQDFTVSVLRLVNIAVKAQIFPLLKIKLNPNIT